MAVSNYNKNKLVYIYESSSNHNDTSYTRIDGPLDGGFVLDSESSLNINIEFTMNFVSDAKALFCAAMGAQKISDEHTLTFSNMSLVKIAEAE